MFFATFIFKHNLIFIRNINIIHWYLIFIIICTSIRINILVNNTWKICGINFILNCWSNVCGSERRILQKYLLNKRKKVCDDDIWKVCSFERRSPMNEFNLQVPTHEGRFLLILTFQGRTNKSSQLILAYTTYIYTGCPNGIWLF